MQARRPFRVGEILDVAITLYRANWQILMGAAAVVAIPLYILTGIALEAVAGNGDEVSGGLFSSKALPAAQANARVEVTAVTALVSLLITGFIVAASARAISDIRAGRAPTVADSLRPALRRVAPLVVIELIYVVGIALGIVLFIVPGVWIYVAWSLGVPALIIEGRSPLAALARSRNLIRGWWGPVAGAILLAEVIVAIVGELLTALLGGAALGSHPTLLAAVVVRTLTGIVAAVILQPFTAIVYTVLFYELGGGVEDDPIDVADLRRPAGP